VATLLASATPAPILPEATGLEPLETIRSRWPLLLGGGITLLLFVGLVDQLFGSGLKGLTNALPSDPRFYVAFLALYLTLPVADYLIFRRLWGLPLSGLVPLLKKRVANEMLLGYSGEAYFYLWARRRAGLTAAPFGTIKDVNILSALVGNLIALVLVMIAWPFLRDLDMGRYAGPAIASAMLMMAGPVIVLILSRRLFTLPRPLLFWVSGVHLARTLAGVFLSGLLWHCALPGAPIGLWLVLATLRLLIGRLPLVPNKEVLFAAVAVFLMGQEKELVALIGLTTTAMLLLHLVFGGLFFLWMLTPAGRGEMAARRTDAG